MITVEVDLRPLEWATKQFPEITKQAIRLPLLAWQGKFARDFLREKLSGPQSGSSLNRRTGRTLSSNFTTVPSISDDKSSKLVDFSASIGFIDPQAARIARVHELGTVGKGGKLPDIVPIKGKFLWIPVTSLVRKFDSSLLSWAETNKRIAGKPVKTHRKSKKPARARGVEFILLRKASIPARLGFGAALKDHMATLPAFAAKIPATVAKLINKAMAEKGGT